MKERIRKFNPAGEEVAIEDHTRPMSHAALDLADAVIRKKETLRVNDAKERTLKRSRTNSEGAPRSINYFEFLRQDHEDAKGWRKERDHLYTLAQLAGDSDEDSRRLLAALDDLRPKERTRAERLVEAARMRRSLDG